MSRKQATVLGFYHRQNTGDEAYKLVIPKYLNRFELTFVCIDDLQDPDKQRAALAADVLIIGGGDLINRYFCAKLKPLLDQYSGPVVGLSLGFPYESYTPVDLLRRFNHLFIRNYEDLPRLQRLIGSDRVHYLPDLTFNLKIEGGPVPRGTCGVFLVQNLIRFPSVVTLLTMMVKYLTKYYHVILYRFNYSGSDQEDDSGISRAIFEQLPASAKSKTTVDLKCYPPEQFLMAVGNLDLAVCLRYHSHIFAMVTSVPLVSLSCTRKTQSLMEQAGLSKYQLQLIDERGNCLVTKKSIKRLINDVRASKTMTTTTQTHVKFNRFLLDSDQVQSLILSLTLADQKTDQQINEIVLEVVNYSTRADQKDLATICSNIISHRICGTPDSSYQYGLAEKLEPLLATDLDQGKLKELIRWIHQDYQDQQTGLTKGGDQPFFVDLRQYQSYKDVHRSGWYEVVKGLAKVSSPTGVIFDLYVDRTFHWHLTFNLYVGRVPYTSPWIGFIHHPLDTEYSSYNTVRLFQTKEFIQSLTTCRGLFVLNNGLRVWIEQQLKELKLVVPVLSLVHPTAIDVPLFDVKQWQVNPTVTHVGCWLRQPFSFYLLKTSGKFILQGSSMETCLPPADFQLKEFALLPLDKSRQPLTMCRPIDNKWINGLVKFLQKQRMISDGRLYGNTLYVNNFVPLAQIWSLIQTLIGSVTVISLLDNQQYDNLLARTVVFLHLKDVAAANTITECIVRRTPLLINKLPGTIELLGPDYPLFYHDLEQAARLLTLEKIMETQSYLSKISPARYHHDHFIASICNSKIVRQL